MVEEWTKWEPITGLSAKYYIDSISYNNEGFKVLLSEAHNPKKQVVIFFENGVEVYRSADETYRYRLFLDLSEKYGDLHGKWTFFKVTNSLFLKWISEQSCTISDDRELIHYSLITGNDVLDIADPLEPKVEIIHLP